MERRRLRPPVALTTSDRRVLPDGSLGIAEGLRLEADPRLLCAELQKYNLRTLRDRSRRYSREGRLHADMPTEAD